MQAKGKPVRFGGWLDYFAILLVNLLFFQPALQSVVPFFRYIDEAAVLLLFPALILTRQKKPEAAEWRAYGALLLFLLAGLISNAVSGLGIPASAVAVDVFTCAKFFLTVFLALRIPPTSKRAIDVLFAEAKVLTASMFLALCLNTLLDIGMTAEIRYGLRAFQFIFPHPTYLASGLAGLLILFSARPKENRTWILLVLVLMASTIRSKALVFAAVVFPFLMGRSMKRWVWIAWGAFMVAGIAFALRQVNGYYILNEQSPRLVMSEAALRIAGQHPPLGSGFGSFGSYISGEYYSPLYALYGIDKVWGLQAGNTAFLYDTFWPTVLGQTGWLGCFLYAGALALLCALLFGRTDRRLEELIPAFMGIVYLLITSTSESSFFNPNSVYIGFMTALCLIACRAGWPRTPKPFRGTLEPDRTMEEEPLITVIVPVYNTRRYLKRCVHSLTRQTLSSLEILLIDDGSTDGSGERAEQLAAEDPRIRVVHQPNGGLSAARNTGLECARGQWVGFVDSDDFVSPDTYERLLRLCLGAEADVAVCGLAVERFYGAKRPPAQDGSPRISNREESIQLMLDMDSGFRASVCNKFFRRSLFDDVRFEVGLLNEDALPLYEVLRKSSHAAVDLTPRYFVSERPGSITRVAFGKREQDLKQVADRMYKRVKREFPKLTRDALRYRYYCYVACLNKGRRGDAQNLPFCLELQAGIRRDLMRILTAGMSLRKGVQCVLAAISLNGYWTLNEQALRLRDQAKRLAARGKEA